VTVLTFRDFIFRAQHHIAAKFGAAAIPHWHTYRVRFFFSESLDQDALSLALAHRYQRMHGVALNSLIADTSDEGLAAWFLEDAQGIAPCAKIIVQNDYQRGAEASR
jgi:hypothetical protein